jgi:vacuolar protein sorting-associated protein 13A/C
LSIPWSDLKNKPLKVSIKDLFLLCAPKYAEYYDPEEEDERVQQIKKQKLEAAEKMAIKSKGSSGIS